MTRRKGADTRFGVAAAVGIVGGIALGVVLGNGGKPGERLPALGTATAASAAPAAVTGPYAWRSVAINGGGFVSGIVTHPKEKGLIYARTDVGGAYRWEGKANRWVALTDFAGRGDWNLYGIESLAVDPSDPNRVYLAAGTYTNDWAGNGAVLRSDDRGATWKRIDLPFKLGGNEDGRSNGERLAVDPKDGRTLFLGTRVTGLWKSLDRGATWKRVESFPTVATAPASQFGSGQWVRGMGIVFVQFLPGEGNLLAGVSARETSLFRSTDGGATWAPVSGQPTGLRPNHAALAGDGALYVSYGDGPGPNGMADGAVWKWDTKSGAWTDVTPLKPAEGDRFGYGGVTVDAAHPDTVMACTMDRWGKKDEVFRSLDGGKTWKPLLRMGGPEAERAVFDASSAPYAASLSPHWMGDIEIDPFDPDHVLFVTGYGIWVTHDATAADKGGTPKWSFDDTGLEETVPIMLASPPTGDAHLLSAIGDFDGFRHVDLEVSPRARRYQPSIGTTRQVMFAAQKAAFVVRVGGRRAFFSNDGGVTWTPFFGQLPGGARGEGVLAVAADASALVWGQGGALSLSRDQGATWQPCAGLTGRADAVVADPADAHRFYALAGAALYASTDGGATFAALAAQGMPSRGKRSLYAASGALWLTAERGGLFRSTDSGATFTKVAKVEEAVRLGFGKAAPGRAEPAVFLVGVVGETEGVFRSDDAGATWTRIDDAQHRFGGINTITGDPRIWGRVYLGTGGRGILYGEPSATGSQNPKGSSTQP